MMRGALLTVLMVAFVATGCIGPRSAVVFPACVDRIQIEGQHTREGERTIVLDHTFDLPLSRTEITFETERGGKKTVEHVEAVNAQPDLAHLLVGAGVGGLGGLLSVIALREVVVEQVSPFAAQPFYAGLFGSTLLLGGAFFLGTGWHPAGDTVLRDTCAPPPQEQEPEPEDGYER